MQTVPEEKGRVVGLIDQAIRSTNLPESNKHTYKYFYVRQSLLNERGVEVEHNDARRPLLIIGGTSITLSDSREFLEYLLESGYEVVGIDNPLGGPLDFRMNPARDRVSSLNETLKFLKAEGVRHVDIIAQSYSAFEVIRTLSNTNAYKGFVKGIIFINPPGLNPDITFTGHIVRFLKDHLAKGFFKSVGALFGFKTLPVESGAHEKSEYSRREIKGICRWTLKTFQNLARSLREVKDITSFQIIGPLQELKSVGYNINFFLHSEDQLVPVQFSARIIRQIFPKYCIKMVPGGHNDLFFQKWQRGAFKNFLKEIRFSSDYKLR